METTLPSKFKTWKDLWDFLKENGLHYNERLFFCDGCFMSIVVIKDVLSFVQQESETGEIDKNIGSFNPYPEGHNRPLRMDAQAIQRGYRDIENQRYYGVTGVPTPLNDEGKLDCTPPDFEPISAPKQDYDK